MRQEVEYTRELKKILELGPEGLVDFFLGLDLVLAHMIGGLKDMVKIRNSSSGE